MQSAQDIYFRSFSIRCIAGGKFTTSEKSVSQRQLCNLKFFLFV